MVLCVNMIFCHAFARASLVLCWCSEMSCALQGTTRTDEHLNIFLEYVPGGSIASLINSFGEHIIPCSLTNGTQAIPRALLMTLEIGKADRSPMSCKHVEALSRSFSSALLTHLTNIHTGML